MSRGRVAALVLTSLVLIACDSGTGDGGSTSGEQPVAVGRPAPDFTLPSAHGEPLSLADFRGEKPVLLYFSMGPG